MVTRLALHTVSVALTIASIGSTLAFADEIVRPGVVLTYIPGSSHKIEQVNGDCDWVPWDATLTNPKPTCLPTVSQTATRADVLGNGLGASFEHDGEVIFLFGDTIGATTGHGDGVAYYPTWVSFPNSFQWQAGDPIARSHSKRAEDGLLLDFFMDGSHGLVVQPPPQPDGTPVDMGPDNIPSAGISLDRQIYLVYSTGVQVVNGKGDYSQSRSVLGTFDEKTQTFTSGRTISSAGNGGHFVYTALSEAAPGHIELPPTRIAPTPVPPQAFDDAVVMFGVGVYRDSNIYLAIVPKQSFASGVDSNGKNATVYYAGLALDGFPKWTNKESEAVPVVTDVDPANPTIGNLSAFYSPQLGLWLMMFDGGRNDNGTTGFYFTYAQQPWGPWSTPTLVFNDCRDGGYGKFIRYYYKKDSENVCPSAMPPGNHPAPDGSGPTGPTIGPQSNNDPVTTRGGAFAPQMIQRFAEVDGDTLKIFYNASTWNPYAVVLMESDFKITRR